MAHHGVLFLDELPEFPRQVLDVLREPLESGEVVISRANRRACFPAQFQLVAAMNPSPSGFAQGDQASVASQGASANRRYLSRLSGPFLDRFDLHVEVPQLPPEVIKAARDDGLSTEKARHLVAAARERMLQRQQCLNAQLSPALIETHCKLNAELTDYLVDCLQRLNLSMRAYHRILRLALTLADLESTTVQKTHIQKALGFRQLRKLFRGL